MNLFDLHCDTIVEIKKRNADLFCKDTQLNLGYLKSFEKWCQAFAIFIPDEERGKAAEDYFELYYAYFEKMLQKHSDIVELVHTASDIDTITEKGKCAAILAVEGGGVLAGKLENVQKLAEKNVKMLTLTWNGEDELASGHNTQKGFTDFGREAVKLMEEQGVIVDVSHLNDVGFEQLTGFAKKPFLATHSNSRSICSNRRNLTDEQFKYIVENKGIVGLNLFEPFVNDEANSGTYLNLMKHVYHMLELGGEDTIACGSDFDGAEINVELDNPEKFGKFGAYMMKNGLGQTVVDKIMYGNALGFFRANM